MSERSSADSSCAAGLFDEPAGAMGVRPIDANDSFMFGFSKVTAMLGRQPLSAVQIPYRSIDMPGLLVRAGSRSGYRSGDDTGHDRQGSGVLVVALGADLDPSATAGPIENGNEFSTVDCAARLREVIPTF